MRTFMIATALVGTLATVGTANASPYRVVVPPPAPIVARLPIYRAPYAPVVVAAPYEQQPYEQQPCAQESYAQPTYAQPTYALPTYVQAPIYQPVQYAPAWGVRGRDRFHEHFRHREYRPARYRGWHR